MDNRFIKQITINWNLIEKDSYLRKIESLKSIKTLTFNNNITFLVGENGTGKSTLLEAIAVSYGFNPEGGSLNYQFSTYDSHSSLHQAICIGKGLKPKWGYFLRAESFYNVASQAEEYRGNTPKEVFYNMYGGKSLHEQSHGESFLNLMIHNIMPNSLYILDEPEAALSPQRQLSLLIQIEKAARYGSQFIIVTHSPILLGIPKAKILSFDDGDVHEIEYEDTESYKITEMFINNRDILLKHLLEK